MCLFFQVLKNLYPPSISTKMVLDSLDTESKSSLLKGPKSERNQKIKNIKKDLRNSKSSELLPLELRSSVCVGLRQCLKEVEAENLQLVIYDTSVNMPAIRCLIDKGKIPIVGVPELGAILKSVIGFPGMTLGFKKTVDSHFQSFLATLPTSASTKADDAECKEPNRAVEKIESPKTKSSIEVLRRKEKSTRVFKPNSTKAEISVPKVKVEKAKSDFISFSSEEKTNSYLTTVIKMV